MERITKIILVLTIGMAAIGALRIFYFLPNLFFPVFFIVVGYILYKEMLRHRQIKLHPAIVEHAIPWLIVISVALLFEGHGMNYGTNIISHSLQGASDQLKQLVFYYDEVLSHRFWFGGLFGLLFAGALLQISRPFSFRMNKWDEIFLGISGVLFGIGLATSLIEGVSAFVGIAAILMMFPLLVLHHQRHTLKIMIRNYPLNYFVVMAFITILVFMAWYSLTYGGLIEPSKIVCARGYENACVYAD